MATSNMMGTNAGSTMVTPKGAHMIASTKASSSVGP